MHEGPQCPNLLREIHHCMGLVYFNYKKSILARSSTHGLARVWTQSQTRKTSQALPLLAAMAARSAAGSTEVLCERS